MSGGGKLSTSSMKTKAQRSVSWRRKTWNIRPWGSLNRLGLQCVTGVLFTTFILGLFYRSATLYHPQVPSDITDAWQVWKWRQNNDYKTSAASYFAFEVAEEEDQRQEQRQGDDDVFLYLFISTKYLKHIIKQTVPINDIYWEMGNDIE